METPLIKMNKSNFQLLAEELEKEIVELKKEVGIRQQLLEKSPTPGITPVEYITDYDAVSPNKGTVAGLGVGAAANPTAVVLNPALISAAKGRILPDTDSRVVKYKPYYSNNVGNLMGFGLDQKSFERARDFIKQYSPPDGGGVVEKDDPEESIALDWKKLNNAVSNYNSQKVKDVLSRNHLFKGDAATSNYEQGLSDQYQVFTLGKRAKKAVDDTVNHILGKPKKSKGKQVSGYVRKMSESQEKSFNDRWTQNPDPANIIKFGNKK